MNFQNLGGLLGAIGVAAGAYGAHGLGPSLKKWNSEASSEDVARWVEVFKTGTSYLLLHGIALQAMPLVQRRKFVGPLLGFGAAIFGFSCMFGALKMDRAYSRFAPYGGMMIIAGWLVAAIPNNIKIPFFE